MREGMNDHQIREQARKVVQDTQLRGHYSAVLPVQLLEALVELAERPHD